MPLSSSSLAPGLLLLVAAACSEKQTAEPAASLEGTWVQTRQTEHIPCPTCPTQRFLEDVTYPAGAQTLTLTPNEYILRKTAQNLTYTFPYVRRGDTLLVTAPAANGPVTTRTHIIELKRQSLHLQLYVARGGASALLDMYFTR